MSYFLNVFLSAEMRTARNRGTCTFVKTEAENEFISHVQQVLGFPNESGSSSSGNGVIKQNGSRNSIPSEDLNNNTIYHHHHQQQQSIGNSKESLTMDGKFSMLTLKDHAEEIEEGKTTKY